MRNKIKWLFAITLLLITSTSCANEASVATTGNSTASGTALTEADDETSDQPYTGDFEIGRIYPLMKTAFFDSQKLPDNEYLQYGDGILYFSHCEGGYNCGYFDMKNSVANEKLITLSSIKDLCAYRINALDGYLIAGGKLSLIDVSGNNTIGNDFPTGAASGSVLIDDSSALIYTNAKYVLTAAADFSEQYVLCEKAALPDFSELLAFDKDNKRIYYTTKDGECNTGYAYFDYGKNTPEVRRNFKFTEFHRLGGSNILFISENDGVQTFTVINLSDGTEFSHSEPSTNYAYGYSASADGKLLALYWSQTGEYAGGHIDIIDMAADKRTARYELNDITVNPEIILSPDGQYVFFGTLDKAADGNENDSDGELINLIKIN